MIVSATYLFTCPRFSLTQYQYATTPFKGTERNDTFANTRLIPVHFRQGFQSKHPNACGWFENVSNQLVGPGPTNVCDPQYLQGFYHPIAPVMRASHAVYLLEKNERRRLGSKSGASEVKQHKWFSKINWGLLRNTRSPVRSSIQRSNSTSAKLEWATDRGIFQIIPSLSQGHDAVNFRHIGEPNSLHLEDQGGGGLHNTPGPGLSADDGLDSDGGDLFGAFSSVTLHYDGES
jgi:protein-serine/threonine kinase